MIDQESVASWIGKKILYGRWGRKKWKVASVTWREDGTIKPYKAVWFDIHLVYRVSISKHTIFAFQFKPEEISCCNHSPVRAKYLIRMDDNRLKQITVFERL